MWLDPARVWRIHDRLAGGTNGYGLGQVTLTGSGDPGHLGGEVGDVVLFALQGAFGNKDREVAVVDAHQLDSGVEEVSDLLPNEVGPRS